MIVKNVFLRFVFIGVINTGFTYIIYIILQNFFHYHVAYVIAYVIGIFFSYIFNSLVVFKTTLAWKGLFSYPLVYLVQYSFSAIFLSFFVEFMGISPKFGPLIVLMIMVPLTFYFSRWILTMTGGDSKSPKKFPEEY